MWQVSDKGSCGRLRAVAPQGGKKCGREVGGGGLEGLTPIQSPVAGDGNGLRQIDGSSGPLLAGRRGCCRWQRRNGAETVAKGPWVGVGRPALGNYEN